MQSGLQTMLRGMSHCFFMLGTGLLCTLMMMVFSDYRKMVGVPHDAFTVERIVACLCCYLLALGARNPGATRFVGPRMCEGLVVVIRITLLLRTTIHIITIMLILVMLTTMIIRIILGVPPAHPGDVLSDHRPEAAVLQPPFGRRIGPSVERERAHREGAADCAVLRAA